MEYKYLTSFTQNSLDDYLTELKNYKILDPEEQKQLARKARKGDREAFSKLVVTNLDLVISIAKYYFHIKSSLTHHDLVQEGNIGLMKAIQKYNPDLGYNFSTYAKFWIHSSVARALEKNGQMIRYSVHKKHEFKEYLEAYRILAQKLNHEPSSKEIGEYLGKTEEEVLKLKNLMAPIASTDILVGEYKTMEWSQFISSDNEDTLQIIEAKENEIEIKELVLEMLGNVGLTEREYEILMLRYGFFDGVAKSLDEVGVFFGVTKQAVNQLELKALKKCRDSRYWDLLKTYRNYHETNKKSRYFYK